jgi:hypothetical protein
LSKLITILGVARQPPPTLAKYLNKREQHGESSQQPTMQDHCKTIEETLKWNMKI